MLTLALPLPRTPLLTLRSEYCEISLKPTFSSTQPGAVEAQEGRPNG